jgi:putative tricarboxylic transport membrane protein
MNQGNDPAATSVRTMEIAVALFIFGFGALVVVDSMRLGAKWAEDGPQAGYFPFYIGLILCIASAVTFVRSILDRAGGAKVFVTRGQLKLVLAVLMPLTVYVVLIPFLGIYVASILFITWFMWHLGRYSWLVIVPVAIGTMFAFFMMFEMWFKVPLPKGPLEAALGFA